MRTTILLLLAGLGAAGCGGSERQDADEPAGRFAVDVEEASFPRAQHVSRPATLRIRVRNAERERAIPNVAVTVEGLGARSSQPGLSDPNRPVWIVDRAPAGGTTAYTNTWALGTVPGGGEREFVWRLTPVAAGRHVVSFRVAAGLDGKAVARLAGGAAPAGRFTVTVSGAPADARIDPRTGDVVRE